MVCGHYQINSGIFYFLEYMALQYYILLMIFRLLVCEVYMSKWFFSYPNFALTSEVWLLSHIIGTESQVQHSTLVPPAHTEIISVDLPLHHEISGIWVENTVLVQLYSRLPNLAELFHCWLTILLHKLHCSRLEAAERLSCFKELCWCMTCVRRSEVSEFISTCKQVLSL